VRVITLFLIAADRFDLGALDVDRLVLVLTPVVYLPTSAFDHALEIVSLQAGESLGLDLPGELRRGRAGVIHGGDIEDASAVEGEGRLGGRLLPLAEVVQ